MTVVQNPEANVSLPEIGVWASTHQGVKRDYQQDAFYVDPKGNFMIVADGMGGQPRGDEAAVLAVTAASDYLNEVSDLVDGDEVQFTGTEIRGAFAAATTAVFEIVTKEQWPGHWPGTTLVIAARGVDGDIIIGNVGDSRAYALHDRTLTQVTVDHEDRDGSITRFVPYDSVNPDIFYRNAGILDNETILLCSDGLFLELSNDRITQCLLSDASNPAVMLVSNAVDDGGRDNVTAVVWQPR